MQWIRTRRLGSCQATHPSHFCCNRTDPCRVPWPAPGRTRARVGCCWGERDDEELPSQPLNTRSLTSCSSPRTQGHSHGAAAAAAEGWGGRVGKSWACVLMPASEQGCLCSGRRGSSPRHAPSPPKHTRLSSPCFNGRQQGWAGACRAGTRGGSGMAGRGTGEARVRGGRPLLPRTRGTAWRQAHSSELSGLLPPHGGARASFPSPKGWPLRETLSPHHCIPSSPRQAGRGRGEWGGTGGPEPVQAAGGAGRASHHLPCSAVSPSHQSCRPPAPSARWPPPVLERLLPAPPHVLCSQHGCSSPR